MNERIQIMILAMCLMILIIEQMKLYKKINQLEENQEVLRKEINKLERLDTNEDKYTTSHYTEKE